MSQASKATLFIFRSMYIVQWEQVFVVHLFPFAFAEYISSSTQS